MRSYTPTQDTRNAKTIAKIFLVVAAIGFIPGTIGMLMAALTIYLAIVVLPIYWMGCALMHGYWKYLRDRPLKNGPQVLWVSTLVYNLTGGLAVLAFSLEDVAKGYGDALPAWFYGLGLLGLAMLSTHALRVDSSTPAQRWARG